MARRRHSVPRLAEKTGIERLFADMQLEDGPRGLAYEEDWTDEEWELHWRESRDRLIAKSARHSPGTRPWAWWWLDAPEGPADEESDSDWDRWLAELEFLAEIGELTDDELSRSSSPAPSRGGATDTSRPSTHRPASS